MKSKVLSKQDREEVLKAVNTKALEKWNDSPLFDEMLELAQRANEIVAKRQMEIIPPSHRQILDLYSGRVKTVSILLELQIQENGEEPKPIASWSRRCDGPVIDVKSYYVEGLTPRGYPVGSSTMVNLIHEAAPDLLPRFHELWHLRDCEVTKIKKVFSSLLDSCTTTKQVHDNEHLRPFLPQRLVVWKPTKRETPTISNEDEALVAELTA